MSAPAYRIERVSDFLQVPADRIGDCLSEFTRALEIARGAKAQGLNVEAQAFTWVDDGRCDETVNLTIRIGE